MLALIINLFSHLGFKYHYKKMDKYEYDSNKFAYHTYMCQCYLSISEKTLETYKLHDKYIKNK